MTKPFILDLVKRMSLREKAAQLTQLTPLYFGLDDDVDVTGPLGEKKLNAEDIKHIGSVLGVYDAAKFMKLQRKHLQENPYGIPLLNMCDVTHGLRTIFPIPLAMACSWDMEAVRQSAVVAARESAYMGIHITYSPMGDVVRDPRWGRVMESPGEDTHLGSRFVEQMIAGYQGDDPRQPERVGVCFKHLAGYGAAEGGRDYNTVDLSRGVLREYHLPIYYAAVCAGAVMAMTSFNTIERVPATVNRWLLRDVLRGEWGFDGVVVSDFNAVDEVIAHGVAADGREAAAKSVAAGLDIEMMSTHYLNELDKLVAANQADEARIDESVIRVLELKDNLGLFDNPYKDCDPIKSEEVNLCPTHRQAAREVARKSIVLLKNDDGVLPLSKRGTIGLVGPFAESTKVLGGWWALGQEEEWVSLNEGLRKAAPRLEILAAMTGELARTRNGGDVADEVAYALYKLHPCDTVLVAVGEHPEDTGEACSKTSLQLSSNQRKLIQALSEAGKKIITIIFSGRPLELAEVHARSHAVVQAWFLGNESGNALADVLFGDYNPSGRLAMSFPRSVGQIPVYYNRLNTGRPQKSEADHDFVSCYLDSANAPLYPFGYGLSYARFEYSGLKLADEQSLTVAVQVENISDVDGIETVQWYIRDIAASVSRPVKELKHFEQVSLSAGEKKTLHMKLTNEMLAFYPETGSEKAFEQGLFEIMAGSHSESLTSITIFLK
ncbi:glycoside hydrolase family 3 N-terminal domain-containing protein [Cohnella sp. GCM10012308]|uniref:glycoside hydrolase family 3 N-terminal domain-containing protein n=1 Tax=Cohnella sp. GCM10012308 TaxID=3317329 RepID=UPI00361A27C0